MTENINYVRHDPSMLYKDTRSEKPKEMTDQLSGMVGGHCKRRSKDRKG